VVPDPTPGSIVSDAGSLCLWAWALAFAVATSFALFMLRTGLMLSVVDRPNERSLHTRATPRVGGIPLLLGAFFGCSALANVETPLELTCALMGGVCILAWVGAVDDRVGLPARTRLAWQLVASTTAVALLNHVLGRAAHASLPLLFLDALLVLTITWSANLYNFMDGSDGLAGSMGVWGFGALAWIAVGREAPDLAVISSAFAGASLGFLVFNWHPARMFLGDVGSVPLGFVASVIGIEGVERGVWSIWTPVVAFWPFTFDASWTLARRLLRGARVWEAHREHLYQKLVQMGWGHRKTATVESGMMALCAGLAVLVADRSWQSGSLPIAGLVLASLACVAWVEARWRAFDRQAG
jgi:UDP-N-acetylmuramyl pentapeptide phosphotransferase/UDP-N-acetylglucosamine-1-phosphate transferase